MNRNLYMYISMALKLFHFSRRMSSYMSNIRINLANIETFYVLDMLPLKGKVSTSDKVALPLSSLE